MTTSSESGQKHSRNVCAFTGCGRSKDKFPSLHFYHFPVNRPSICDLWVTNCANEKLEALGKKTLSSKQVCEEHFENDCFTNDMKLRLKSWAVPTVFSLNYDNIEPEQGKTPYSVMEANPQGINAVETPVVEEVPISFVKETSIPVVVEPPVLNSEPSVIPSSSGTKGYSRKALFLTPEQKNSKKSVVGRKSTPKKILTPTKKRLQLKLLSARKLRNQFKKKLNRIAKKPTTITNDMIMEAVKKTLPEKVSNFICMQLSHAGKKNSVWTENERKQALAMRYKSPALYEQMRKDGFNLPSTSTIARWLQAVDLRPGVCPEIMKMIQSKVEHMTSWEKNAVLLFDEMSIKSSLDYDCKRDVIEGLLDLGEDERRPFPATHILLFMARGLINSWKMPFAYFATNKMVDSTAMAQLIEKCIRACHTCGLKIRAVVCDQSSVNRKAAKILEVSPAKPHFMVDDNKVFFIFDFPHVIKCMRNNLMKREGQISFTKTTITARIDNTNNAKSAGPAAKKDVDHEKVGVADWSHLEILYSIDSRANKSTATKLTEKHLKPNSFEKMSVKLATQVFSLTTSAAMKTAVETGELPPSALDTAFFLQQINNIFDVMNSKAKFDPNPYRCAISSETNSHLKKSLETLQASIDWVKSLKMVHGKRRPPCMESIHHSLVATKLLWDDLDADGAKYLLTGRLNQDPIENEFSVARQKCGFEKNPSVRLFRQNLRHRIQAALIQPPKGANCEPDEDELLSTSTVTVTECKTPTPSADISIHPQGESPNCDSDITMSDTEDDEVAEPKLLTPSLESCSVRYFTGYGIRTCLRQFNCMDCKKDLLKPADSEEACEEALIRNREYSNNNLCLIYPQDEVVEVVDVLLSVFNEVFTKNIHASKIKYRLMMKAKRRIFKMNPQWIKNSSECYQHRVFILNKILTAKIRRGLQAISRDLRQPGGKYGGSWQKFMKLSNK